MNYWDKKLIREQLDKKLLGMRNILNDPITRGAWIRSMREALGMTTTQLGKRIDVDQSRIVHMEKSESEGNLKLSTMQKIGEGLGMTFVYGFVPHNDLETMVRDQARKLAQERMKILDHTMQLELQGLNKDEKEKALSDMIDKILVEGDKELWNVK